MIESIATGDDGGISFPGRVAARGGDKKEGSKWRLNRSHLFCFSTPLPRRPPLNHAIRANISRLES